MDKKLKKAIDKLTEKDLFMNEDVRLTYIENVVRKLKQGIFPTSNLKRLDTIIKRHNRIKEMKKELKIEVSSSLSGVVSFPFIGITPHF